MAGDDGAAFHLVRTQPELPGAEEVGLLPPDLNEDELTGPCDGETLHDPVRLTTVERQGRPHRDTMHRPVHQPLINQLIRHHNRELPRLRVPVTNILTHHTTIPPGTDNKHTKENNVIQIENGTATVSTAAEALEAISDRTVTDVVVKDSEERIKLERLLKGMGLR